MADFEITGLRQLEEVGAKLKTADKRLRLGFNKEIRAATRPLTKRLQDSARETLPHSGGLADQVASTPIRTVVSYRGSTTAIRLSAKGKLKDIAATNRGRLRHPVFGNRKVWVTQMVKPGWWDEPTKSATTVAEVRAGIQRAMDNVAKEIS